MISASSFRDKFICSLTISYDWELSEHFADVCVSAQGSPPQAYRITGLSGYSISEDYGAMHISQCTLTVDPERVYLSLDPYIEGTESERDNFTFTGVEISVRR